MCQPQPFQFEAASFYVLAHFTFVRCIIRAAESGNDLPGVAPGRQHFPYARRRGIQEADTLGCPIVDERLLAYPAQLQFAIRFGFVGQGLWFSRDGYFLPPHSPPA